jgi:hypothetical protein
MLRVIDLHIIVEQNTSADPRVKSTYSNRTEAVFKLKVSKLYLRNLKARPFQIQKIVTRNDLDFKVSDVKHVA